MVTSAQAKPVATKEEPKETSAPIDPEPVFKTKDSTTASPKDSVPIINKPGEVETAVVVESTPKPEEDASAKTMKESKPTTATDNSDVLSVSVVSTEENTTYVAVIESKKEAEPTLNEQT